MELIEDLGMRIEGKTKRRWCIALCPYCEELSEHRTQSLKAKKSCGCHSSKLKAEASTRHGCFNDRLYQTWADMKTRCNCDTNSRYHRYGGRGIKVTKRWDDFINFKLWAENNGYEENLTIDRIDNDGNYQESNCEWITIEENIKRRNRSLGWKSNY